jgi:hypothetical protein
MSEGEYNDILWSVDPYAIEALRGFINWGSIRLHKYFLIRERHGALELRIATLRSCGRKDSTVLNHEFLGVSDLMLTEAVAECEKSKKCAYRGDYGISEPIRKALEEACEDGRL